MTRVDVIVAVRSEEASIPDFLARLRALELPRGVDLALLFVEDSSDDGTVALLRRVAAEDPRVRYSSLRRGHGQGVALMFGLSRSSADAAILMDVDGGHPPEAIPAMVQAFLEGAQVVQCTRRRFAHQRLHRRIASRTFLGLARAVGGVDLVAQNVFFRLVSAQTARWLLERPRYWSYLRFPLHEGSGGAVRVIPFDAVERSHGRTKYGPLRLAGLGIDGLLSMTSTARLGLIAAVAALGVGLLLARGLWPLALGLAAAALGLAWRYHRLGSRKDLLERIEVVECSNAAMAAPPS